MTSNSKNSTAYYGSIERKDAVTIVNYNKEEETRTTPSKNILWKKMLVGASLICLLVVAFHSSTNNSTNNSISNNNNSNNIKVARESESFLKADTYSASWQQHQREPSIPVQKGPFFYQDQQLNHFNDTDNRTWSNLYYTSDTYFAGPGHPIFVIIGGEGPVTNILYPYVTKRLAREFQGFVLQTEHRFYGASQPVGLYPSNDDMKQYLSPEQALADWIQLIQHMQQTLGCDTTGDKSSPTYCPVVTIGGSYPGFLSAMMRVAYPTVVDIGYASSAPLILYEHLPGFDTNGYYDKVSEVAEEASPGCAQGVQSTLQHVHDWVMAHTEQSPTDLAAQLGICASTFPDYMKDSHVLLARELTMLVVASNADFNMAYYPPSPQTDLVQACELFSDNTTTTSALERYAKFIQYKKNAAGDDDDAAGSDSDNTDDENNYCFDLQTEIATGTNATLSSADWSGAGDGENARMWEFQICQDLVVQTGFAGPHSMFAPQRAWTLEWLTQHCASRFDGVVPQPGRMRDMWHYDDLVANGASRILFTNGLKDGWSVSSYLEDLSDSILALNFINGAHHSDLSHEYPVPGETSDIEQGHEDIVEILRSWLENVEEF